MKTENSKEAKPPYVAYKTFSNFISGLRESGLPNRIDRSVLSGMSGASQSNLMAALNFFGFITEQGSPTANFKELVDNQKTEKAIMAKIVKEKYDFVFTGTKNIEAATESELLDKFREKDLTGETVRKCLSFFAIICQECGITLSPHLKGKRSKTTSAPLGARRSTKRKKINGDTGGEVHRNPPATNDSLQDKLLAKFPEFDPKWEPEMQKKWFETFEQFMKSAKKSDSTDNAQ